MKLMKTGIFFIHSVNLYLSTCSESGTVLTVAAERKTCSSLMEFTDWLGRQTGGKRGRAQPLKEWYSLKT